MLGGILDTCQVFILYIVLYVNFSLVARIAQDYLEEFSKPTLQYVEQLLKDSNFQNYLHLEDKHPFVECATFADEIKESGFGDLTFWHYVDTPLVEDKSLKIPSTI